jgi:pimeloyl-ACP methyl ester carboxylesterase
VTTSHTEVQSSHVDVNGQRLHYKQWSDSGPPLIFLHGVTASCSAWDDIAPQFATDYRVMAFDFRGHGLSSKPDQGYTWTGHYAPDIVDFVQDHLDEPAVLIGSSLGAVVSAPIAAGSPEKVRGIVMSDPPAFAPFEDPESTRDRFTPTLALKRLPYEQRIEKLTEEGGDPNAVRARADSLEAMSEGVLVEMIEGKTAYSADEWLPRVSCPALVFLGNPELGGVVSREDPPRLGQLLGDATLVEFEDAGHGIHRDQPDRFVREVRAFLQRI